MTQKEELEEAAGIDLSLMESGHGAPSVDTKWIDIKLNGIEKSTSRTFWFLKYFSKYEKIGAFAYTLCPVIFSK